ncbi:DUF1015 domain-containing protein [Parvicella tangerina]|uniref:DUF1015 domain-containing protein n=1 Tax=Parvicella tangerina TaxID=2829795 RepID=A0A916NC09_9FLAO|nr:DUF1015 domain-containing protein [Parvicella tangerina]CAG5084195.1 hypothetical protein CRYO30217_02402 [Parvicella tangerina]
MAKIKAFKAVRPPRDKVYLVASRPFYTYKKKILEAKLKSNKFTFLHVINPEFQKDDRTEPNSVERFEKVRSKYDEFLDLGYFFKDEKDSFYVYRQQYQGFDCLGIIAGVAVEEYLNGKIRIHEHTLTKREETFKRYLDVCNFNAEPVLLTYEDNPKINSLIESYLTQRAEYEFTTTDDKTHHLWTISDDNAKEQLIKYFEEVEALYIADGHHRSASSVLYAKSNQNEDNELKQHFLGMMVPHSKLKIYDYNRVVTSLNGMSEEEFLLKVGAFCDVTPIPDLQKPSKSHQFSMLLGTEAYQVTPKAEFIDLGHPVKSLDAQILNDLILDQILGIKDAKTDNRLLFVDGTKGMKGIKRLMMKAQGKVAFALFPVSFEELKKVADTGNVMPPKSTWIEPKLRSGLTIYEYDR